MRMYISDNMQYLRKEMGITRKELAAKLGIKLCRLNAWLEGRCEPGIHWLINIANLFNVTLQDLVTEDLKQNKK